MEYSHLKFFDNSMRATDQGAYAAEDDEDYDEDYGKSASEKHIDIVEYLKKLPKDQRATSVDFERVLKIKLDYEDDVLDMLKNNSKIDKEESSDGVMSFQYIVKYDIKDKKDLLRMINRVKSGLLMSDVKDMYPDIGDEVKEMIVSGEIIACKNGEKKTQVLYPRGLPFYVQLPGEVTAHQGRQMISTSVSLTDSIRRGDAIKVNSSWFRVSSSVESGQTAERNKAPFSVTSDKDLSSRNVYSEEFDATTLPLDGDYDGEGTYRGPAFKHGCTNDIRACWAATASDIAPFFEKDQALQAELLRHKLITRVGVEEKKAPVSRSKIIAKKPRKKRAATSSGQNRHLIGTDLEFLAN